ncbi:glutathione synthetase [Sphingobacterium sp. ML3W]|uniref:ATP-grasp domain-containing protein n=2 Tax=Sphingobacteriaceae TaxID=84566 RepID=UPI0004F8BA7A|nr:MULTISPECIES: ATP-grasp domain-containing protein [Sphingobacterium]AIM37081.1 glutathione synthetase [Sphingobacterium sp. ML3W]MDH5826887.1 ATP-grasp domain-containing protein [Sphingobacterium faecium]
MKIAFIINQTHKEKASFTTTLLALKALQRGHSIYYIGLADFVYLDQDQVGAHARAVHHIDDISDTEQLIDTLRSTTKERVFLHELDILWLRYDPVLDMINRPWAAAMGLQFAQLAQNLGVRVLNNPRALIDAENKLYLENFPEEIRPRTIVTRSYDDVKEFFEKENNKIILKPLKGSGGKNVFLVNELESKNLKQIVEVICRDGYLIAQEYLPDAQYGDIRFFLLNGKPLVINGKYASVHRVQPAGELRSNIHQGAKAQKAIISPELLAMVEKVAEKLAKDGMYFVGLDIIADKIMEINVFSPGALLLASALNGEDYAAAIIADLEQSTLKK